MKTPLSALLALLLCAAAFPLHAEEQTAVYRLVGLSAPERQDDFRQVMDTLPEVHLVQADFAKAQVTLRYEPTAIFPNVKAPPTAADAILKQLNELFRKASRGTFTIAEVSTIPADKLTELDLKIGILDCKACRYAAYLVVAKMDGVDRATLDTTGRLLSIWFDAEKTNRAALEEALKKERVELPAP